MKKNLNQNEQIQLFLAIKSALMNPNKNTYPFKIKQYVLTWKRLLQEDITGIHELLKGHYTDKIEILDSTMKKYAFKDQNGDHTALNEKLIFNHLIFCQILIPDNIKKEEYDEATKPLFSELDSLQEKVKGELDKSIKEYEIVDIKFRDFENNPSFPMESLDVLMELGLVTEESK